MRTSQKTVVESLRSRAETESSRVSLSYVNSDGEISTITYEQLDASARSLAAQLQDHGAQVGDRALLLYPAGLDFAIAYFGCLYAGVTAIPSPQPRKGVRDTRLASIAANAKPGFLLTTPVTSTSHTLGRLPELDQTKVVIIDASIDPGRWKPPSLSPETPATLQYTSGSTSDPKGVIITHQNLLSNIASAKECFGFKQDDLGISWLPHYHDMGLIAGMILPIICGIPTVLMSPASFVQRPARWLERISSLSATISIAPALAYQLATRRVSDEILGSLKLASWGCALNGAEPIRWEVMQAFADRYKNNGFRIDAFYPCYGLAEATLIVTGRRYGSELRTFRANIQALGEGMLEASENTDDSTSRILVSCGPPAPEVKVMIVDPDTSEPCPPGKLGEIWVHGEGVAAGYWDAPEATEATFGATIASDPDQLPYLRTRDIGVIADGELYVTGRLSDLMIFRGRNVHPEDVEATVATSHPLLQESRGAAFSIELEGEECLVVVHELPHPHRGGDIEDAPEAVRALLNAVAEEHQVRPVTVILVSFGSIPLTSSGKIRRKACKGAFLSGSLDVHHRWDDPRLQHV